MILILVNFMAYILFKVMVAFFSGSRVFMLCYAYFLVSPNLETRPLSEPIYKLGGD